jgi:hypothetical protein
MWLDGDLLEGAAGGRDRHYTWSVTAELVATRKRVYTGVAMAKTRPLKTLAIDVAAAVLATAEWELCV